MGKVRFLDLVKPMMGMLPDVEQPVRKVRPPFHDRNSKL